MAEDFKKVFELRDTYVDGYRGLAFVNMVFYHLVFNLWTFGLVQFNLFTEPLGVWWRGFIVSVFLLCVGIALGISTKGNCKPWYKKVFSKTNLWLLISAIAVSMATYVVFPQAWVYFGILHFILCAKIICLPLVGFPKVSLVAGIVIVCGFAVWGSWNPFMAYYGQGILPVRTVDIVNILPWLSVVFFGIFLAKYPFYKHFPLIDWPPLCWCGRHALILYLGHQIILFPVVYVVFFLMK